jgi:hypothetical protein
MQAQEFVPAKWAIAQRVAGTESAVDSAYAAGDILRTHVLRPTWHFVAAQDVSWLLALTGPRVHQLNAYYYRKFGLTDDVVAASQTVFRATDAHLTRVELAGRLASAGIEASGLRLGYLLMRAELDQVLISGVPRGKQQTYARYEERVPAGPTLDRDAALAELTRRYLATRGPATVKDLATWASLTVADANRGIAMQDDAVREVHDGRTYWSPTDAVPAATGPAIELIQGYDEYVMSYGESKDLMAGPAPKYLHTILLAGKAVGTWKQDRKSVVTDVGRPLTSGDQAALAAAVARFDTFLSGG